MSILHGSDFFDEFEAVHFRHLMIGENDGRCCRCPKDLLEIVQCLEAAGNDALSPARLRGRFREFDGWWHCRRRPEGQSL